MRRLQYRGKHNESRGWARIVVASCNPLAAQLARVYISNWRLSMPTRRRADGPEAVRREGVPDMPTFLIGLVAIILGALGLGLSVVFLVLTRRSAKDPTR